MKKIILIVLSVLLLASCSEKLKEAQIAPNNEWWYKGHHYLEWSNYKYCNYVHDPDCSCHLDTLSIYVVENNDTTYIIRK